MTQLNCVKSVELITKSYKQNKEKRSAFDQSTLQAVRGGGIYS